MNNLEFWLITDWHHFILKFQTWSEQTWTQSLEIVFVRNFSNIEYNIVVVVENKIWNAYVGRAVPG